MALDEDDFEMIESSLEKVLESLSGTPGRATLDEISLTLSDKGEEQDPHTGVFFREHDILGTLLRIEELLASQTDLLERRDTEAKEKRRTAKPGQVYYLQLIEKSLYWARADIKSMLRQLQEQHAVLERIALALEDSRRG